MTSAPLNEEASAKAAPQVATEEKPEHPVKRVLGRLSQSMRHPLGTALIAGVVSLAVSLLTNHLQNQAADQRAQSDHQLQAMQVLQSDVTTLFNGTFAIRQFQQMCVSSRTTWSDCGREAPQFGAFGNELPVFDVATNNVSDADARQMADQFQRLCVQTVDAQSEADASTIDQIVDAYLALTTQLGQLIQGR